MYIKEEPHCDAFPAKMESEANQLFIIENIVEIPCKITSEIEEKEENDLMDATVGIQEASPYGLVSKLGVKKKQSLVWA